jgi:hypothetical protein
MRYFRIEDADGISFGRASADSHLPKGAVEVPRMPKSFEDWRDGRWVRDEAAAIDEAHLGKHGRDAIARAHAIKAVEAGLMLGGVAVDGLIAAEAKACGIAPTDLAKSVAEHTSPLIKAEVARRRAKSKIGGL